MSLSTRTRAASRRLWAPLFLTAALGAQFDDFHGWSGFDAASTAEARTLSEMVLCDIDGDGHQDLATVSEHFAWHKLVVLLNRGDNTFGSPRYYELGNGARDLVAADLDLDGDLDVAVSEGGDSGRGTTMSIFENPGDGDLLLAQRLTVPTGPLGIAAGDFDDDGDPDLVLAIHGPNGAGSQLQLVTNQGGGTFAVDRTIALATTPHSLEAADLDGDGRTDLAVAHARDDLVSVVLNSANGLVAPVAFKTGPATGTQNFPCIATVDIDRDGDLDIAYSDSNHFITVGGLLRGSVSIIENSGGVFAVASPIVLQGGLSSYVDMDFADYNGDGWMDVVGVDTRGWSTVMSDGEGGFVLPAGITTAYVGGDLPYRVRAFDVDRDGDPDALILNRFSQSFSTIRFENGAPVVPITSPGGIMVPSGDIETADLDGDGVLDMVGGANGPIWVSRGLGDGRFTVGVQYNTLSPGGPRAVALRDLNGDGRPDLLWATISDFGVRFGDGAGGFGAVVIWTTGTCGIVGIDAFDMDNDGDLDVFAAEGLGCPSQPFSSRRVFISRNRGNGTFDPPYVVITTLQNTTIGHADLNGDGNQDFVVGNNTTYDIHLGNGDGSFQPPVVAEADFSPQQIAIADFDGDGALDIASANWGDINDDQIEETMSVVLGRGDGTFGPVRHYAASYSPTLGGTSSIAAGDVDRDGDVDLMVGNYASGEVSFYRNRGDGTFEQQARRGGSFHMTDLLFADFDGDGIGDVAAAGQSSPNGVPPSIAFLRGLGGDPWVDLGGGLAGARGVPFLDADGALVAGSTWSLDLYKAVPGTFAAHIVGTTQVNLPLLGTVLIPSPDFAVPVAVNALGEASLAIPLTAGLPSGVELIVQTWVLDGSTRPGVAVSNAVRATTP